MNDNDNYNPYNILNIDEKSSLDEIKSAYKKLARKYHPDRNFNNKIESEQKFKEISKAYNILMQCDGKYNLHNFPNFSNINNLQNLFNKGNLFKNLFMNFNMDNITNNLLKEAVLMSKYFEESKTNLPKTESLNINAKIELFDIYHNIEKTININRKRKCPDCVGIGYGLDRKFELCAKCNGEKIFDKQISLIFKCKYKSIMFPKKGDECDKHIPGNIYLNIIPKDLRGYRILNNFDLLYIKYLDPLKDLIDSHDYIFELKHFDNKNHTIKVVNLILNKEYIIEDMGLYNQNSNKRNNLIIMFMIKPNNHDSNIFIL